MLTAVPAMPGIAPIAAAIKGINAGKNPPRKERLVLAPFLERRLFPVPLRGTARADAPVAKSVAVTGMPLAAAALAAAFDTFADRQTLKLPLCSRCAKFCSAALSEAVAVAVDGTTIGLRLPRRERGSLGIRTGFDLREPERLTRPPVRTIGAMLEKAGDRKTRQ